MAGSRSCAARLLLLCLVNFPRVFSGPTTVPVHTVADSLIRSALDSLNGDSPTHHTYKGGNLISAQKLVESPYVLYRLTFDLNPICKEALEPCPREACTIDIKQHELGVISVLKDSIQCMYLYPQSIQDDVVQVQEGIQEQETVDTADKPNVNNQSVELDHEIQASGDQNDRPFIAVRANNPSYCPGCPYELNPNLPGLAAFGKQVEKSMDESIRNDFKYKVVEIVKVTRAVPPSTNVVQYQILFKIAESDCLKNAIAEQSECFVQPGASSVNCLVTFEEQPWQQSSRQITRNNCTLPENVANKESTDSHQGLVSDALITTVHNKEQSSPAGNNEALESLKDMLENFTYATPGRSEDQERPLITEHPIIKVLMNRSEDIEEPQKFANKEKEFTDFLEDFDLPTGEEKPNPDAGKEEVREEIILPKRVQTGNANNKDVVNEPHELRRSRRNAKRQVGAPQNKDINDPEIQEFAKKGLHKFSENSEGSNEPIIIEITDASVQVVSGLLYKIKAKLGTSTCPKGVKENCQLKADGEIKECLFSVWSQPWQDKGSPEITINCDMKNRKRRSLRGKNYSQKMLQLAESMTAEALFDDFLNKYSKSYSTAEEKEERFRIFQNNLKTIEDLRTHEQGTGEYGVTMFADLTREEFKARHLGLRTDLRQENEIPVPMAKIPDIELPLKFDWRDHNVVTPVKNQGMCGSCWAFSVTGNVEGQFAIQHGKLLSLSEQELVDCDTLDDGCGGGLPDNAYRAIEKLGGLELESDYPYDGKNEKCHFNKNIAKVQLTSAVNITTNETQMAQWLVKNGPISIGINANAMQFYIGGVSHPMKFLCNPKNLDHGVLIVGYGKSKYPIFHKELPYWIVKNSWGKRWGERGYYRVYRGDGTCGVNAMASSAVVA